jgi:hypothetical protein
VKRQTRNLSLLSEHRLNAYTLAATAAGVGALCFAKPAEARIVYTPAHVAIKANGGPFFIYFGHDGTADFGFSNKWYVGEKSYRTLNVLQSRSTNEVWMTNSKACGTLSVAAALPKGKRIGPKRDFKHNAFAVMAAAIPTGSCGVWLGQSHLQAYLGLKFTIKGKIHFGWARVKVDTEAQQRPFLATLTGYAYETIPNKAIIAGATKGPDEESGSLGALAAGAAGR